MSGIRILEVTDTNYKQVICSGITLLECWTSWCRPSQVQGDVLREVAVEFGGGITFGRVNLDENQRLKARFDIRRIPTILVFRDGELLQKLSGFQERAVLECMLEPKLCKHW